MNEDMNFSPNQVERWKLILKDPAAKLALVYLAIALLGTLLFFTGICSSFFLFYGPVCILPAMFPWGTVLAYYIYFFALPLNLILNTILIYVLVKGTNILYRNGKNFRATGIYLLVILALVSFALYETTPGVHCDEYDNSQACYYSAAGDSGSTKLCDKIVDQEHRGRCYYSVGWYRWADDAEKTANSLSGQSSIKPGRSYVLCDKLDEGVAKDTCYSENAEWLRDIDWCKKILDGTKRFNCVISNPNTKSRELPSEDWKTYSDLKDNFEFSYPNFWTLSKTDLGVGLKQNVDQPTYSVAIAYRGRWLCPDIGTSTKQTLVDNEVTSDSEWKQIGILSYRNLCFNDGMSILLSASGLLDRKILDTILSTFKFTK